MVSIHSRFQQDEAQATDRVLKAMENPWVDALGHPTGRMLLKRDPVRLDMERVAAAAAQSGVALEINSQPHRLDLNDAHVRVARERGVRFIIATDAHSTGELGNMRWGITVARRGWLEPESILNTRPVEEFRPLLRRNRRQEIGRAHV